MDVFVTILLFVVLAIILAMDIKKKKIAIKNLRAQNAFYNAGIKFFTGTEQGKKDEKG